MPMKLNVGVSRKVGLPDYGSVGASCNVELELESGLIRDDLEGFHARVRSAYLAAHRAVRDELARLNAPVAGATPANGDGNGNGHPDRVGTSAPPPRAKAGTGRLATPGQVKAIRAIAHRAGLDLRDLLGDYRAQCPEELGIRQASELIDGLKATIES